jgi:hypothetical protein
MYLVGAGLFFALLSTAQSTTQPLFQDLMDRVPGLNSGSDSGVTFGNPES